MLTDEVSEPLRKEIFLALVEAQDQEMPVAEVANWRALSGRCHDVTPGTAHGGRGASAILPRLLAKTERSHDRFLPPTLFIEFTQ